MAGRSSKLKGGNGEREVCKMLNDVVRVVRHRQELMPLAEMDMPFQRNQNQSAVGGDDITNPFGLSIEVKRQEALSVPAWWRQCVASAKRTGGRPILIYRQNRKPWRIRIEALVPIDNLSNTTELEVVEIDTDQFKSWFEQFYRLWLMRNE